MVSQGGSRRSADSVRKLWAADFLMGSIDVFRVPCSFCVGGLYPIFLDLTELDMGFCCSWCEWKYDRAVSRLTLVAVSKTGRHQLIFGGIVGFGSLVEDFLHGDEACHRVLRRRASLYRFLRFSSQLRVLTSSVVVSSRDPRAFEYRDDLLEFVITFLV